MTNMQAVLKVTLKERILVSDSLQFDTCKDGYTITIKILKDSRLSSFTIGEESGYSSNNIEIYLSREEPRIPNCSWDGNEEEANNYREFYERYSNVCFKTLRSIISFFQYSLNHPLGIDIVGKTDFKLMDDKGNTIESPGISIDGSFSPAMVHKVDLEIVTADQDNLQRFKEVFDIEETYEPNLAESILSEGQLAIVRGDLRRAVLDIAVATEISILQKFIGCDSKWKSPLLDLIHDSGGLGINPILWINGVANALGCQKFSKQHKEHNKHIVSLFNGRNSVAHRGELWFLTNKMDINSRVDITKEIVTQWYRSTRLLIDWLKQLEPQKK